MAVASTSLASQMSGPKSATSISCPQFSGLRKSFSKLDNSVSFSTSQAFFQTVDSHLRLSADRKGCRAVVAMAGSGKFFVGGNWKCNGTKDSISKLVSDLNNAQLESDVDVVVAPPFLYIDQVKNSLTDRIEVSAQNCWTGKGGAFTGEISVEQVKDLGCKWVILGHSERRHVIGENDEFIGKKAAYALSQGVGVIACIGELLQEREAGKTFDVCFQQLKAFADAIPSWDNVVIAYEPVWAIGTVASPDFSCHNHVQQAVNCFDTIYKAWYEALDFSHKGLAGVCHQMHFVHLKVNVTAPRLPMLSLARSLDLNLEDKVLIEDGSIVMNQPQPNRDTNKDITQIDIGPSKSNRARPSQIVWDPGPFTLC